ncbi:Na+/H+ antiporter NhaC family protein [Aeromicrobium fastidiosum]|uniref:Na+/H+ antiporter NhaC family protein n=2 Tax=Aeromicrobium fastidiosum TaxID=52699 RepID=A0A641AS90_9ACTN|nr:Na+/H+ antiporter NhaC family protein [Aeromicrobium fastidiosum]
MSPDRPWLEMRGSWLFAFVPVVCFVISCVALFAHYKAFDLTGLAAGGIVSLLIGALFAKDYSGFWDAVMRGIASPTSVTIIVILFVIGMFSELVKVTNLSSGFVWIGNEVGLNGTTIVVFTFLAVCLIAMATGSSIGTMFTAFPIFFAGGIGLGADPALLAGAIISGAIFGDNLAPISDTTIISASTQRFRTKEGSADIAGVVRSRARYSLVAAAIAAALFLVLAALHGNGSTSGDVADSASAKPLIMLVPVALLMITSFITRDIFKAITVGLITGIATGLLSGLIHGGDVVGVKDGALTGFIASGVQNIIGTVALVIAVFGIMGVLTAAGVLDRAIGALLSSGWVHTPRGAEVAIGLGITATTAMFGGVNSASMMTFGPVADDIGSRVGLHPYRRCNVMDSFAMGLSCVIPFVSAFLFIGTLLTTGYDGVQPLTALDLFPAVLYPLSLTVVMVVAVATGWGRTFEGPDGTPVRDPRDAAVAVPTSV